MSQEAYDHERATRESEVLARHEKARKRAGEELTKLVKHIIHPHPVYHEITQDFQNAIWELRKTYRDLTALGDLRWAADIDQRKNKIVAEIEL